LSRVIGKYNNFADRENVYFRSERTLTTANGYICTT